MSSQGSIRKCGIANVASPFCGIAFPGDDVPRKNERNIKVSHQPLSKIHPPRNRATESVQAWDVKSSQSRLALGHARARLFPGVLLQAVRPGSSKPGVKHGFACATPGPQHRKSRTPKVCKLGSVDGFGFRRNAKIRHHASFLTLLARLRRAGRLGSQSWGGARKAVLHPKLRTFSPSGLRAGCSKWR